ncbi:MAG: ATP phosphoribosyltransferase regulatory subunit, partial [Polyangiaceae bacterium]
ALSEALARKDSAQLEALLRGAGTSIAAGDARALRELPQLAAGGSDEQVTALFGRARALLAGSRAEGAGRELEALWRAALDMRGADLGDVLHLDLGEVRGLAYYTGVVFQLLADGPGEPIGSGGRYDGLLERFGLPMPAIGFALQLDAVAWARSAAGMVDAPPRRVLVAGDAAATLASALREGGLQVAVHSASDDITGYARAWGFTHIVRTDTTGCAVVGVDATPSQPLAAAQAAAKSVATRVDGGEPREVARRVLEVVRRGQP